MTLPIKQWAGPSTGHDGGTVLNWMDAQADVDDMIQGFVDVLLPFWPNTTTFLSYTVYTYATEDSPARPQVSLPVVTGAGSGGATIPAAQATFNFKTDLFGTFKLVMLDAKVSSDFGPISALVSPANDNEIAVRDYLMADEWGFSGRDNSQIAVLNKITYTLNEKLRAEYRLD